MGRAIDGILFLLAGVALLYGLIREDFFSLFLWPPGIAPRFLGAGALFAALAIVGYLVSRRTRLHFLACLTALLLAQALYHFGVFAVLPVLLFFFSSYALGSLASRVLRQPGDSFASLLAGMALFALLFSWLSPWTVHFLWLHALLLALPCLALFSRPCRDQLRTLSCTWARTPPLTEFAFGFLALQLSLIVPLAAAPELSYDGLAVHLFIPSQMATFGRWLYDPFHYAFSFMPAAGDFLYAHLFLFGGEEAAKFFNFTLLPLLGIAVYRLALLFSSSLLSLAAVALFFSAPITVLTSSQLYVENTLALWLAGAALFLLERKNIFFFGVVAGAALATKLIALPLIALLALVALWQNPNRAAVTLVAVFCLLGSFPYAYAWFQTGNPVFPFFNDLFRAQAFPAVRFTDARWQGKFGARLLYDLTFRSREFWEGANGSAGFAWLLFLPVSIWLGVRQSNKPARLLSLLTLGGLLTIIFNTQYLRYFYAFAPMLAAILAFGLAETQRLLRPVGLVVFLTAVLSLNTYTWPAAGLVMDAFSSRSPQEIEENAGSDRLATRWINSVATQEPRVIYASAPSGALLRGTAFYSNWYSAFYGRNALAVKDEASAESYIRSLNANFVVIRLPAQKPFEQFLLSYLTRASRQQKEFGPVRAFAVPAE